MYTYNVIVLAVYIRLTSLTKHMYILIKYHTDIHACNTLYRPCPQSIAMDKHYKASLVWASRGLYINYLTSY